MRLADSLWTEWKIALRFLLDNRMQTLLITFGIAVGSAVIVFITALITGLQANVIQRTLGTQAHIRILPRTRSTARFQPPPTVGRWYWKARAPSVCVRSSTGRTCVTSSTRTRRFSRCRR